jgi:hypothetical protein
MMDEFTKGGVMLTVIKTFFIEQMEIENGKTVFSMYKFPRREIREIKLTEDKYSIKEVKNDI